METVYIVTRTCFGEDYEDPETGIEVFGSFGKAEERFDEIIAEESEYIGDEDLELDVEEDKAGGKRLDYTDVESDYRVKVTLGKKEVK